MNKEKMERISQKLLEKLYKINLDKESSIEQFKEIADLIGANELLESFVSYEQLEQAALNILEQDGICELKHFLDGVEDITRSVYFINVYGEYRARNVTRDDLLILMQDLEHEIKSWQS
jgi:hypothetical protein